MSSRQRGSEYKHPQTHGDADLFSLLASERRQRVVKLIRERGTLAARDLAEIIAAAEAGEDPPPRPVRHTVYVSLQQNHLPRLDEADVIDYEPNSKEVAPGPRVDELVRYLDISADGGITWAELYAVLAVAGLVAVTAAGLGTPLISRIPSVAYAGASLGILAAVRIYQRTVVDVPLFCRVGK